MKLLLIIFIIANFILVGMAGFYFFKSLVQGWDMDTIDRALAECSQSVINLAQEKQSFCDLEKQIEYERSEVEEEVLDELPFDESLYYNPIDVYVELEKDPICVDMIFNECYKWSK